MDLVKIGELANDARQYSTVCFEAVGNALCFGSHVLPWCHSTLEDAKHCADMLNAAINPILTRVVKDVEDEIRAEVNLP